MECKLVLLLIYLPVAVPSRTKLRFRLTVQEGGGNCRLAGIGLIFSSLIASTARNPQIRPQLFSYAILGFALAEATGLFSLMIAFLLLYS